MTHPALPNTGALPILRPRALGKYVAIAVLSLRQRLSERAALWGRMLFYLILLLIFSRLWQAVLGGTETGVSSDAGAGAQGNMPDAARYVWYLAVTEWIMLSQPSLWLDIETDVRKGDVAYQLTRPASYAASRFAEALGELALRLVTLGAWGATIARIFSGAWPSPQALVLAVLVGVLASVVLSLVYAAIGLTAFWVHDCTSVYLIWQKLSFILGGLMLPLDIYPAWLRTISEHTLFAALLYGPGQVVLHGDPAVALRLALQLLAWGSLAAALVAALEMAGRRSIALHGG